MQVVVEKLAHGASKSVRSTTSVIVGEVFGWQLELCIDVFEKLVVHETVLCDSHIDVSSRVGRWGPNVAEDGPHGVCSCRIANLLCPVGEHLAHLCLDHVG